MHVEYEKSKGSLLSFLYDDPCIHRVALRPALDSDDVWSAVAEGQKFCIKIGSLNIGSQPRGFTVKRKLASPLKDGKYELVTGYSRGGSVIDLTIKDGLLQLQ